jgi:hypothetical protein
VSDGQAEVAEREESVPRLDESAGNPREKCGLGGEGDRKRLPPEQHCGRDGADGEPDRAEERGEVAVAREPTGREDAVRQGGGGHGHTLAVERGDLALEEHAGGEPGYERGSEHERRRQGLGLAAARRAARHAGPEDQQPDDRRHDDVACGRIGPDVEHEPDRLSDDDDCAGSEEGVPAAADRDRDQPGEDEGRKGSPERADLGIDRMGERDERRADEAERRDGLRVPGQRDRRPYTRDPGGDHKRGEIRNQAVHRGGGEQRRVAARDAGADGRDRRVELPVPVAHHDPAGEHQRRRERAEQDALRRPDPAAIDGEDEEEDDAQQRHDATRPGERTGAEQVGRLDLGQRQLALPERRLLLRGGRRSRLRRRRRPRALARCAHPRRSWDGLGCGRLEHRCAELA